MVIVLHPRRLAVLACSLAALFLQACATAARPDASPAELRVISFNVRYGTASDGADSWPWRRGLTFQVIRDFAPDLLGVQEALRGQLDELGMAVPGYSEIGVGRDDGRTEGEYSAILYRQGRFEPVESGTFWFSDTPEVPGSMHWGNRITRIATWARLRDLATGRSFVVYNLHFDHESQPSRERSAALLAQRLSRHDPAEPRIVMGDFNSGEDNPAYRYLVGSNPALPQAPASPALRDTYRTLHPGDTLVGTFNEFKGTADGEKIDHILVSDGWHVLEAAIIRTARNGRYPSDHFPVIAVLRPISARGPPE